MRFISRPLREGEYRTFRNFLWLPLTIDNETRWLEFATVEYCCHVTKFSHYWEAIRFVDQ